MEATCKTCPFYCDTEEVEDGLGACMHGPPTTVPVTEDSAGRSFRAAFPGVHPTWFCSAHPLRQRDRLAAVFAQSFASHPEMYERVAHESPRGSYPESIAEAAYLFADAMLAEAAKEKP